MPKLFFVLLGCMPPGRKTEQHDVFAGIGEQLRDLLPEMIASWPEAQGRLHIDAWREVSCVNGFKVHCIAADATLPANAAPQKLWFVNLGGYQPGMFEELHEKILVAAESQREAIRQAKQHPFFQNNQATAGKMPHVDDQWAFDVDELTPLDALLPLKTGQLWKIVLTEQPHAHEDRLHIGYVKLTAL